MTHPQFMHLGSFDHLRLGRRRPVDDPRTLRLAAYLDAADLPPVPDTVAVPAVPAWPMYGNNELGDCTCAAAGHMVQAWKQQAGAPGFPVDDIQAAAAAAWAPDPPADEDVLRMYWETGSPPAETGTAGSPQDDGRAEISVLNYWRHTGLGSDRIAAYVAVDPRDEHLVRAAIYLFGGVYTGIALPRSAQGQSTWDVVGDGKTGDSAPYSWGGHAVPYVGFDAEGVQLVTWGGVLTATWAFHHAYTDELYAVLSKDMLAKGKSAAGLDVTALRRDLRKIAAR